MPSHQGEPERYPLLRKAREDGRVAKTDPPTRGEPRCGPWTDRGDGTSVCDKCGEVSGPYGGGPFGPFGF